MKHLSSYIQYLLRRNDKVIIPDFGALIAVELPAFQDAEGKVMLPPKRTIYFDNDIIEDADNLLLLTVSKSCEGNIEKATTWLADKIIDIKSSLQNHGMSILGRLGQFYKKEKNINFIPGTDLSSFDSFSLLSIVKKKVKNRNKSSLQGFSLKGIEDNMPFFNNGRKAQ